MVMYIWVLLPFVAKIIIQLLLNEAAANRALGLGSVAFLIVLGIAQSFSYFNSCDANVGLAGLEAGYWLVSHDESGRIVIENHGFAERMVIPIVTRYLDHFVLVSGIEMLVAASGQPSADSQVKNPFKERLVDHWVEGDFSICRSACKPETAFQSYRVVIQAAAQ